MIPVHAIGRRERDGKLFAIVNTKDVPAGVEHSFTFSGRANKALVCTYAPLGHEVEDLPKDSRTSRDKWTWVRLADICPIPVQHLVEYDGRIAAVIDARLVPRDVMRSRARWSVPLDSFINEHHPAEAKDVRYQGPAGDLLGDSRCWMFLDQLWGVPHAPAGVAPAKDDDRGYTVHKGMNGDVGRVRNAREPVSCGYSTPDDIDGLTREECFRRYAEAQTSERMREDGSGARGTLLNTRVRDLTLTAKQLEAAREEWSARLHAKVEASAAADKVADESVVGWDPYGDEP